MPSGPYRLARKGSLRKLRADMNMQGKMALEVHGDECEGYCFT